MKFIKHGQPMVACLILLSVAGFSSAQNLNPRVELPRDQELVIPMNPAGIGLELGKLAREAGIEGDFVVVQRTEVVIGQRVAVTREIFPPTEFRARYGYLVEPTKDNESSTIQDAGESGIPTPPPPDGFDYSPGDLVIFYRLGDVNGRPARRTTVYQYGGGGGQDEWIELQNGLHYCDIVDCDNPPQPDVGF